MQRRYVLKGLVLAPVLGSAVWHRQAADVWRMRFWVAGVRYQNVNPGQVLEGLPLQLRQGSFANDTCYKVTDSYGRQLGYLPRSLVTLVAQHDIVAVHLYAVRPYAVPWRQLAAEVTLKVRQSDGRQRV
jgi:hypothetical protein